MSRQLLVFNCEQIKIYCFALLCCVDLKWLMSASEGFQAKWELALGLDCLVIYPRCWKGADRWKWTLVPWKKDLLFWQSRRFYPCLSQIRALSPESVVVVRDQ